MTVPSLNPMQDYALTVDRFLDHGANEILQLITTVLAVGGAMFSNEGWEHPPGSDLIAWHRQVGEGRLVYLQPGDGPATYADPNFRRMLMNALDFVALELATMHRLMEVISREGDPTFARRGLLADALGPRPERRRH